MELALLGINHTQTKIKEFEPIFLNKEGKKEFRTRIAENKHINECVILTTCNRIEFYFTADNLKLASTELVSLLSIQKSFPEESINQLLRFHEASEAIRHLFEVASGVQSMVLGENEILGQVKEAYDNAFQAKLTGPILNKCFQIAIAVGKRARAETTISRGAYSVSSIAIEAIRQHRLDYFDKSICILGLGTMGVRCLKKLHALGHPNITLSNRTQATADLLASQHAVNTVSFNTIFSQLNEFDIIISAMAVREYIINKGHINNDIHPLIIDLGLPRNVEPDTESVKNITLINVDGLKEIASKNIHRRHGELNKVFGIIDEEMTTIFDWYNYRKSAQKANKPL